MQSSLTIQKPSSTKTSSLALFKMPNKYLAKEKLCFSTHSINVSWFTVASTIPRYGAQIFVRIWARVDLVFNLRTSSNKEKRAFPISSPTAQITFSMFSLEALNQVAPSYSNGCKRKASQSRSSFKLYEDSYSKQTVVIKKKYATNIHPSMQSPTPPQPNPTISKHSTCIMHTNLKERPKVPTIN